MCSHPSRPPPRIPLLPPLPPPFPPPHPPTHPPTPPPPSGVPPTNNMSPLPTAPAITTTTSTRARADAHASRGDVGRGVGGGSVGRARPRVWCAAREPDAARLRAIALGRVPTLRACMPMLAARQIWHAVLANIRTPCQRGVKRQPTPCHPRHIRARTANAAALARAHAHIRAQAGPPPPMFIPLPLPIALSLPHTQHNRTNSPHIHTP